MPRCSICLVFGFIFNDLGYFGNYMVNVFYASLPVLQTQINCLFCLGFFCSLLGAVYES